MEDMQILAVSQTAVQVRLTDRFGMVARHTLTWAQIMELRNAMTREDSRALATASTSRL